jgi:hypothetical protein
MNDTADTNNTTTPQPSDDVKLPPQASAQDTSNWDDREFTTPSGRVVIETKQDDGDATVVAE